MKVVGWMFVAVILAGCSRQAGETVVENGVQYTTISAADKQLLIIEPADRAKKDFETTIVYLAGAGAGGTVDSKCYTCWREYYDCIFGGGTSCAEKGKKCNAVCRAEKGQVLAPATFRRISRKLEK